MTSRSLRNPGRLARNRSGTWSASLCIPDSSGGWTAQQELGGHKEGQTGGLSPSKGLLPLFAEHGSEPYLVRTQHPNGLGKGGAV